MTDVVPSRSLPLIAVAVLAALGLGYGIARYTATSAPSGHNAPKPAAVVSQTLTLPAAALTLMDIGVEVATAGQLGPELLAPATITVSADSQAQVTAHVAGTVTRISAHLGDSVRAGGVLATLESRDLSAVVALRTVAESRAVAALARLAREQQLFDQKVTPRQDLEAAQSQAAVAQAEADSARAAARAVQVSADGRSVAIVSPISGRVTAARATLGAYVSPDTELFRITDPRAVLAEASLPATDAVQVNAGDAATVTTSTGLRLAATVRSITPAVNEQTRSATVLLALAAGQGLPMPGEMARASILPAQGLAAGIVIPAEAVQVLDGHEVVFVRSAVGFTVTAVRVGTRSAERALILSGLAAGEQVATRNAFLLKAEASKGAGDDEE